jgi:uncharacterized protein (TIGR02147 family)
LGYIRKRVFLSQEYILAVNLFDYTDYRQYLRDTYTLLKRLDSKISHRYIAQRVGFSSSSFFSQVIKKQSNISNRLVFNFARFLKLNKRETEYFNLLVQFNQARSHDEKKHFYEKLLGYRRPKAKNLESNQYKLLKKWYYITIRQILSIYPFKGEKEDYKMLAKMIVPSISPAEAQKAIELLKDLKLIQKNEQGYYKWKTPSITTGEKSNEVGIQTYLLETLELGKQALDRFPKSERKISTLTLSLSAKGQKAIEERISAFRKELLEIAENDDDVDRVYHMNVQFFPMTKNIIGRKR